MQLASKGSPKHLRFTEASANRCLYLARKENCTITIIITFIIAIIIVVIIMFFIGRVSHMRFLIAAILAQALAPNVGRITDPPYPSAPNLGQITDPPNSDAIFAGPLQNL